MRRVSLVVPLPWVELVFMYHLIGNGKAQNVAAGVGFRFPAWSANAATKSTTTQWGSALLPSTP